MQGYSREFLTTIRETHEVRSRVDVIRDDIVIMQLDATSGYVDMDATAKNTRRFEAQCTDPTGKLTPQEMRDILAPFGTEVRVHRGALVRATEEKVDVDTTTAQWAEGTHTNTIAHASGDLILD